MCLITLISKKFIEMYMFDGTVPIGICGKPHDLEGKALGRAACRRDVDIEDGEVPPVPREYLAAAGMGHTQFALDP